MALPQTTLTTEMKISINTLSLIALTILGFSQATTNVATAPPPSIFAVSGHDPEHKPVNVAHASTQHSRTQPQVKHEELSLSDKTKAAFEKKPVIAPQTGQSIASHGGSESPFSVKEAKPIKTEHHDTADVHKGAIEHQEEAPKRVVSQISKEEIAKILEGELSNIAHEAPTTHAAEHSDVLKGATKGGEEHRGTVQEAAPLEVCTEPPTDYLPSAIEGNLESELLAQAIYNNLEQLRQRYSPTLLLYNTRYREAVIAANERKSKGDAIYAEKSADDKRVNQLRGVLKSYDKALLDRAESFLKFEKCKDKWAKHELGDGVLYKNHQKRQQLAPTRLYPISLPTAFEEESGTVRTLKALQDADFFLNLPFLPGFTPIGPHSDLGIIFENAKKRLAKNKYEKQHASPKMEELQRELRQADEMVVRRFELMKKLGEKEVDRLKRY